MKICIQKGQKYFAPFQKGKSLRQKKSDQIKHVKFKNVNFG